MSRSFQRPLPPMEVDRVHREPEAPQEPVNKVHRLLDGVPLEMAKARIGGAVRQAIGDRALKEFGHKGLMHAVCSGEKVPDYLARIAQDDEARRRFAMALLEDDSDVVITTTITIQQKRTA